MTLPETIRTIRWMVRDTLRQSISTKLFWVMSSMTVVCTLLCLSVRVEGDVAPVNPSLDIPAVLPKAEADKLGMEKVKADGIRVISGTMTIGFGAVKVPVGRDREDSVRLVQIWLIAAVADTVGVLLALLWTAGFLPTFLEPQSATVLLAKPAPRWMLLIGKYIGVCLFVGLQVTAFVAGTWFGLGMATGVWYGAYWLAIPLLVLNFAVFYSVSAFLAVWTKSTVASAFGTLIFWLLCWGVNYTHLRLAAYPAEAFTPMSTFLLDAGFWAMPKPLDLGGIFYDAIHADGFTVKIEELRLVQEAGQSHPALSVISSACFALVVMALSAYEFEMTDY